MKSSREEPEMVRPNVRPKAKGERPKPRLWIIVLAVLFLGFLLVHNAVPLYTDWLWFGEVGYRNVFSTTVFTKTILFLLFGALFFALFYANTRIARRLAPEKSDRFLMERFGPEWGK